MAWKIRTHAAQTISSRMVTINVESPVNAQQDDDIGVLVGLWCGKDQYEGVYKGERFAFQYGFTSAEIALNSIQGRILNQGRLEVEFSKQEISSEVSTSKDGKAGAEAGFKFNFPNILGFGTANVGADVKGGAAYAEIKQQNQKYYQVFWRVADSGYNYWTVFGVGLNDEGVLENKILGDELLCRVRPEGENDPVEFDVTYRCSKKEIWFEKSEADEENDASVDNGDVNRNKVAGILVAKALEKLGENEYPDEEHLMVLASQKFKAHKTN